MEGAFLLSQEISCSFSKCGLSSNICPLYFWCCEVFLRSTLMWSYLLASVSQNIDVLLDTITFFICVVTFVFLTCLWLPGDSLQQSPCQHPHRHLSSDHGQLWCSTFTVKLFLLAFHLCKPGPSFDYPSLKMSCWFITSRPGGNTITCSPVCVWAI